MILLCSFRSAVICSTISGFHETSGLIRLQGNSGHRPQNCTWCSLVQACILHPPDSAHSGTSPSASIHPGHLPSDFFGHFVQHSPQAVSVEKSVILQAASFLKVSYSLPGLLLEIAVKRIPHAERYGQSGHFFIPVSCLPVLTVIMLSVSPHIYGESGCKQSSAQP